MIQAKCFAKNNQELKKNLEIFFRTFCIPKIKKMKECQLRKVTMNIAISEACEQESDAEKSKIEIRSAIPFVPESTVESDRIDKNKDDLKYGTVLILPLESASQRIIKSSRKIWRKLLESSVSPRSRKLRSVS